MKVALAGVVGVPLGKHKVKDPRLDQADKLVEADKKTYAHVEVVGEADALTADAIVASADGRLELILKDLEFVETRLARQPAAAARSRNLIDFEFLTQGYHDIPGTGRAEIQKRIDATAAGRYDALLLGYGLCSNILTGLTTAHTQLVIPRAHDCITFFLGSKERYQECFNAKPGTYYYTSGWLECTKRRGDKGPIWGGASLPAGANSLRAKPRSSFAKPPAASSMPTNMAWSMATSNRPTSWSPPPATSSPTATSSRRGSSRRRCSA